MSKVTIISVDDYTAIYVDGVLEKEGVHVDTDDLIDALGYSDWDDLLSDLMSLSGHEYRKVDEAWLDGVLDKDFKGIPKNLADVPQVSTQPGV